MESIEIIERFKRVVKGSQTMFAEEYGVSRCAISEIINGKRSISGNLMKKISKKGISLDWLLTGVGNVYVEQKNTVVAGVIGDLNAENGSINLNAEEGKMYVRNEAKQREGGNNALEYEIKYNAEVEKVVMLKNQIKVYEKMLLKQGV